MKRLCAVTLVSAVLLTGPAPAAQFMPGGRMRVVLLVDSSSNVSSMLISFRAGLNAFLDALPGEPEVALITTGGQLRIRVPPTTDRVKLHAAANAFSPDGGGNSLLESLLEADRRLMKSAPDRRPVFVILSADAQTTSAEGRLHAYNTFVDDFVARGGRAHAVIVKGLETGVVTRISENLVQNTGGFGDTVAVATAVPPLMKTLAAYVGADQ